ncbi:MAG: AraC family transcriptional regulator [Betaproteobacteria bacterium]|nr:AraC family transcriptional regulator [Betaproteobacteria bacterium]
MKAYPDCINLQCIAKDVGYGTFQEFRSFFFNYFGRSPEQIQTSLSVRSKKTALMPAPKSNN